MTRIEPRHEPSSLPREIFLVRRDQRDVRDRSTLRRRPSRGFGRRPRPGTSPAQYQRPPTHPCGSRARRAARFGRCGRPNARPRARRPPFPGRARATRRLVRTAPSIGTADRSRAFPSSDGADRTPSFDDRDRSAVSNRPGLALKDRRVGPRAGSPRRATPRPRRSRSRRRRAGCSTS